MSQKGKSNNPTLALIAVTLAFTFTFLSRYIWSPLMSTVSEEFGINSTQAGLYMSAFFAGYLVTQIPAGILADKYQPKWILVICTVIGGIMTAAMALIHSYQAGLAVRVITGISAGCVMAQCSKVVAMLFKGPKRASAMGVVLASPPFGITLAQTIGAPLNQSIGWRGTFLVVAAVAAIVVVLNLLWVPVFEKEPAKTDANTSKKTGGFLDGLKGFFTNKQQILLGISGFMFMFITVGFATWTNRYVQSIGFTPVQGGMIITAYSIAGIVASCLSGSIQNKAGISHRNFLVLTLSLIAVVTLIFSFQRSYGALIGVAILYGAVSYLPSTHYTTSAMMLAGEKYTATAASTQNLLFQLSSLIMPIVIGQVIDKTGNYGLIWYIFFGVGIASILFALLVKDDGKASK